MQYIKLRKHEYLQSQKKNQQKALTENCKTKTEFYFLLAGIKKQKQYINKDLYVLETKYYSTQKPAKKAGKKKVLPY